MPQSLPIELMTGINQLVLAHLENKSAHSDNAGALMTAVKSLGDVQLFCPDWQHYRYVTASTNNIIFGFAIGMNTIAFRLDDRLKIRALATGGAACLACGSDWVSFLLFRDDWPKVDVEFWALKAYVYARQTVA